MAKFEAKKLDLDLELTLLSGDVVSLSPKMEVNATKTIEIIEQWQTFEREEEDRKKEEEKNKKEGKAIKKTSLSAFEIVAIELEMIYPKDRKWWMDNFTIPLLAEIMTYIAETMGGLKKKEKSSKSSSN